jgi:hypothetical protein
MAKFDLDPTIKLADVTPFIGDVTQAKSALAVLRRMGSNVYMGAGWVAAHERRFSVWVSKHQAPPPDGSSGERITLEEWCQRYSARCEHQQEIA